MAPDPIADGSQDHPPGLNLITRAATVFVGMPWTGPYARATEVRDLWLQFGKRLDELDPAARTGRFVSPCHARRSEFTVWIGVEAPHEIELPAGMSTFVLTLQNYAQFAHRGPMSSVTKTYSSAFAQLRERGVRRDLGALWLEQYDDRYLPFRDDPERAENEYDILLAVEH